MPSLWHAPWEIRPSYSTALTISWIRSASECRDGFNNNRRQPGFWLSAYKKGEPLPQVIAVEIPEQLMGLATPRFNPGNYAILSLDKEALSYTIAWGVVDKKSISNQSVDKGYFYPPTYLRVDHAVIKSPKVAISGKHTLMNM